MRRGRDASYLAPPAQIRTCGFPAYGSHLGYRRQRFAVCEPAPLTHSCGSESGACFADPHSPWSPPLARGRDGEAERLGGLEVDNKLELGWLYDWKRSRADCLAMRRSACLPAGRPCRSARRSPKASFGLQILFGACAPHGFRVALAARFRSGRRWATGILGWCGNITALMIFAICGRTPKSCPSRTKHALPDLAGEWRMSMLLFVATVILLSFGYVPALDE